MGYLLRSFAMKVWGFGKVLIFCSVNSQAGMSRFHAEKTNFMKILFRFWLCFMRCISLPLFMWWTYAVLYPFGRPLLFVFPLLHENALIVYTKAVMTAVPSETHMNKRQKKREAILFIWGIIYHIIQELFSPEPWYWRCIRDISGDSIPIWFYHM